MHCLQKEFKAVKSEDDSLSEKIKIAESDRDFLGLSKKVNDLLNKKNPLKKDENIYSAKKLVYEWYQTNSDNVRDVLRNMNEDVSSLAEDIYKKKKCNSKENNWIEAQEVIARAIVPSSYHIQKYKNIFKKENGA